MTQHLKKPKAAKKVKSRKPRARAKKAPKLPSKEELKAGTAVIEDSTSPSPMTQVEAVLCHDGCCLQLTLAGPAKVPLTPETAFHHLGLLRSLIVEHGLPPRSAPPKAASLTRYAM